MAILPVLAAPHEVLKQKAQPVSQVTEEIRQILSDMLETMYASEGCGLAANQVGVLKRLVVMDLQLDDKLTPYKFVNPEIIWASEEVIPYKAGCLSVPGQTVEVSRPAQIEISYLDENGKPQRLKAEGLAAHCIHHEIDHLNGILMIDYLSPLKKNIALRKSLKFQKHEQSQLV